jgi:hypothetical protein
MHSRLLETVRWDDYGRILTQLHEILMNFGDVEMPSIYMMAMDMFAIVQELFTSPVIDQTAKEKYLRPILTERAMYAYYSEHCLHVELQTAEGLQCVVFPKRILKVTNPSSLEKTFDHDVLDSCPRDDAVEKLEVMQEAMLELSIQTCTAENNRGRTGVRALVVALGGNVGTAVKTVTTAITLLLVLTFQAGYPVYTRAHGIMGIETSEGSMFSSETAHSMFLFLAILHGTLCMLKYASWFIFRGPVLVFRSERQEKLRGGDKDLLQAIANLNFFVVFESVLKKTLDLVPFFFTTLEKLPFLDLLWTLRKQPEFWLETVFLAGSLLGGTVHPLIYTYHLVDVVYTEDLEIVVVSVISNLKRLGGLALFTCTIMLWYALSAFLIFENTDMNANSQCKTLLQCFVAYSLRGLGGQSLDGYLPDPNIPLQYEELMELNMARLLWELAFTLITVSMLGAIITGIICDTFGALRDEKDDAVQYRLSTHFTTGLQYADVGRSNIPPPINYLYFLIYLNTVEDSAALSIPEKDAKDKIDCGRIDWIPGETCLYTEYVTSAGDAVMERIGGLESRLGHVEAAIEASIQETKNLKMLLTSPSGASTVSERAVSQ